MTTTHAIRLISLAAALALGGIALAQQAAPQPVEPAQLRVSTQPEGADVYCDGKMIDSAPGVITSIPPGEHLLVAQKKGFKAARKTIDLRAGQKLAQDLSLDPETCLIIVHSDPPGAEIQVDGADRGRTPVLLSDIPLGRHRMRVSSAGYVAKEIELTVQDRTPRRLEASLTSNSATLDVRSQPPGARVLMDGVDRGLTPCTVDRIPAGDVIVELTKDGYRPFKTAMRLSAGLREAITPALIPIPGTLAVVSLPTGARIYVNNQFRGEAPVTLQNLEPGAYRVRAEMEGYEAVARDVAVERDRQAIEEFRLERNSGIFEVTTEPAGVQVFIDGKDMGVTAARKDIERLSDPLKVDILTIGHHEVKLKKAGFFDAVFPIQVEKDRTVSMHQQLKRRFIPNCEVRTKTDVLRGVLVEVDPQGNVRLELRPGIIRTIKADEVTSRRSLDASAP